MSGDRIVYDREWDVYRIRTGKGVLLGTEYGGNPLACETRVQAEELVERRVEMAEHLRQLREDRRWSA